MELTTHRSYFAYFCIILVITYLWGSHLCEKKHFYNFLIYLNEDNTMQAEILVEVKDSGMV